MFQKLDALYLTAQSKVRNFMAEERGDVNIVSMVVLIGIAVLLAVLFRENIAKLLNTLFNTIKDTSTTAIKK